MHQSSCWKILINLKSQSITAILAESTLCSKLAITLVTGGEPPDNHESQPAAGARSSYWLIAVFFYVAQALGCVTRKHEPCHTFGCFYNLWPERGWEAFQNVCTEITSGQEMIGSLWMVNDLKQSLGMVEWWNSPWLPAWEVAVAKANSITEAQARVWGIVYLGFAAVIYWDETPTCAP